MSMRPNKDELSTARYCGMHLGAPKNLRINDDGFYCLKPVVTFETEQRLQAMEDDLQKSRRTLITLGDEVTLNGSTYTQLAAALESLYFEGRFIQQVATINMRRRSADYCYPQPGELDRDRWDRVIQRQTRIHDEVAQYLENLSELRKLAWARVPEDKQKIVSLFWRPEHYSDPNWSLMG